MPKGPKGQKRPADVIGNAVKVMQIATGEAEEEYTEDGKNKAAQAASPSARSANLNETEGRRTSRRINKKTKILTRMCSTVLTI